MRQKKTKKKQVNPDSLHSFLFKKKMMFEESQVCKILAKLFESIVGSGALFGQVRMTAEDGARDNTVITVYHSS